MINNKTFFSKLSDVETSLFIKLNKFFHKRPISDPYISGDTFRSMANIVFENDILCDQYLTVKNGDIIFVETHLLKKFQEKILPKISVKFILISHNSDAEVTAQHVNILENRFLVKWFAQNALVNHEKIVAIPIGLENQWLHKNGRIKNFSSIKLFPPDLRIPRILDGFNVHTNFKVRTTAREALKKCGLTDHISTNSIEYRKLLGQYMFIASPFGNGVDCHRTWEALYAGAIPIVCGKGFYGQFENFPGLVLGSWVELQNLDAASLQAFYFSCLSKLSSADYLWSKYWRERLVIESSLCD